MNNIFAKTRKKNNSLIKLRKGQIKIAAQKVKKDNAESFTNLYEEYLINRKKRLPDAISKRSIDILSSNNLNIYNDLNNDNKEELETIKPSENIKKNEQNKKNQSNLFLNSVNFKNEKKNKNEDLIYSNDNKENDNSSMDFDNEDINNKSNTFLNKKEKTLYDIKNKKKNKDKFLKTFKKKKTKYDIILNENENEKENEEEANEDYSQELNIKIFYEGKGISIKISKDETLSNCLLSIQKILFPFYKLSDYDILYKLKILDIKSLKNEKMVNIIENSDNSPIFYLRKKNIKDIKNNKDTKVSIENFPSFTDLATELNKFFEKEKRESNFTVDYRGNICNVKFSDSEKAFSLIIYLTKLKKNNPIFKRLKISMDYKLNVELDAKKLKQKPIKLILPLINKNSIDKNILNTNNNKKIIKINTEKNIYNFKSRNEKNNLNSMEKKKYKKRTDSCLTIGEKGILNLESKYIKNKIKNDDLHLNNKKQPINNIKNNNIENYILESHIKSRNIKSLSDDEDSNEIINKLSKIKSTNFIIDLSKNKNKQEKNMIFNQEDDLSLSPRIKHIKKSNYYNLFVNNISKKYKDNNIKQRFSFDD